MYEIEKNLLPFVKLLEKNSSREGTYVELLDFEDKATSPPFKAALFTVTAGCESKIDQHEVKELWLIQSGIGILEYDNEPHLVQAGDILFFDSFKTHKITNNSINDLHILSLWWQ